MSWIYLQRKKAVLMSYLDVLHNLSCSANWLTVIQIFGPYYHLYKHCFQFFFVETSFCPACSLSDNNNAIVIFLMLVRAICLHSYHLVFVGFIPSLIMNRQLTFWLSK
ncbi:unnamed protein product [Musa hybrid cultivar]